MKKWFYAIASIVAIPLIAYSATTLTTNYSLKKPSDGSTSWGQELRDNFDAIDSQMKINSTDTANHIADTVGAHAATAISTTSGASLCVSAITVQAFLDCLDSNVGPVLSGGVVTLLGDQTIGGLKTFSSLLTAGAGLTTSGTITLGGFGTGLVHSNGSGGLSSSLLLNADVDSAAAIARSKLASGTADHVLINDPSGVMSSEAQLAVSRGGTGASSTPSNGQLLIGNGTGYSVAGLTGTASQVVVTPGAGSITLSTPQDIATTSSPEFAGATLTGFSGAVKASAGVLSASAIVDADVDAAAAIARSKVASGTADHVVINSGTGALSSEAQLSLSRGGTNKNITAAANSVLYTDADSVELVTAPSADGQVLTRDSGALAWGALDLTDADTATSGAATDGQVLTADGAGGIAWESQAAQTATPDLLDNCSITASVAANALTIALKDAAGNDPSVSSPCRVAMRSSTLGSGVYNVRTVTGALSTVISSGSTAGHSNGNAHNIYVYLIDNAGTLELAWSSVIHDEVNLISSTAEGGAGAADSIRVMYSTTARSSVPFRLIGMLTSTQATAGTWVTAPSKIASGPRQLIVPKTAHFLVSRSVGYNIATTTNTEIAFNDVTRDDLNSFNAGTSRYVIPMTGIWAFSSVCDIFADNGGGTWSAGNVCQFHAGLNGGRDNLHTSNWRAYNTHAAGGYEAKGPLSWSYRYSAGDAISIFVWQNQGTTAITSTGQNCWFQGHFVGPY